MFKATTASGDASVDAAFDFFASETSTNITVIGGSQVALDLASFKTMLEDHSIQRRVHGYLGGRARGGARGPAGAASAGDATDVVTFTIQVVETAAYLPQE